MPCGAWLLVWCGVLCENCIVDASIKPHAVITILSTGLLVGCWWWVCGLCDFCSFVFCVVHAGMLRLLLFVVAFVCWLCVR